MTETVKAELVKSLGVAVGFDAVGIAPVGPSPRANYYRQWLRAGYGGTMGYLGRHVRLRGDPGRLLPGARSIICVGLSYQRGSESAPGAAGALGRVARYARGRDYHLVLRKMLEQLVDELRDRLGEPFGARVCVDSVPVRERELAAAAGLGWIAKNTCIVSRSLGSYVFLGEAVTTLGLPADQPVADGCARCRRCLEVCPTGALFAPYQLDASRCISYLTIEHRGPIPAEFHEAIGDWVFGCDLCQEVCPYNKKAPLATHPDIAADCVPPRLDLARLVGLRAGHYRRLVGGTALRRASRNMLRRNAAIVLGNVRWPDGAIGAQLERVLADAANDDEPGVRDAATRALVRVSRRK